MIICKETLEKLLALYETDPYTNVTCWVDGRMAGIVGLKLTDTVPLIMSSTIFLNLYITGIEFEALNNTLNINLSIKLPIVPPITNINAILSQR